MILTTREIRSVASPFRRAFTHTGSLSLVAISINVNILQIPLFLALQQNDVALAQIADSTRNNALHGIESLCTATINSPSSSKESRNLIETQEVNSWLEFAESAGTANLKGNQELAAKLSRNAYCAAKKYEESPSVHADIAALAIEFSLDFNQVKEATLILDDIQSNVQSNSTLSNTASLRLNMARARLMSFQDLNEEALKLRIDLQPKLNEAFGRNAIEAVTNRIRTCNLKLEVGRLDEALAELSQLTGELAANSSLGWQTKVLANRAMATALSLAGREGASLELLRNVRNDLANNLGEDDIRVISADQRISEILTRMGRTDDALELASRIFIWRYNRLPIDDLRTLRSLWHLACLYFEVGRFETAKIALTLIFRTIETSTNQSPQRLYLQAMSLDATLDSIQGRDFIARTKRQKVYEGILKIYGPDAGDTQIEAANLALAMRKVGQADEACNLLREVRGRIVATRPDDTWTLEFARIAYESCLLDRATQEDVAEILESLHRSWIVIAEHNDPTSRDALSALGSYANACVRAGHHNDAKRLFSDLVRLVEDAGNFETEGAKALLSDSSSWLSVDTNEINPISGFRQLALMHAQDAELESALRVAELARDRMLRDRFAEQEWRRTRLPAGARRQVDDMAERIQDLEERIAVTPEIVERVRLESERTLAAAALARRERELRKELHIAEPSSTPPTLDELRAHLSADTALVSVMHSRDTWWALVVTRNDPARFVALPDSDVGRNATAWVRRLRGDPVRAWPVADGRLVLDDLRPEGATGPYLTIEQLGLRLSRSLLAPLADALATTRHIVFVGDDELVDVPLQALPLAGGLVLDRFEVSYAPSLTTYARWQGPGATKTHARDLLAIGAIDYAPAAPPATDDPIVVGMQYAAEHPLPFAREEIEAIASLFPAERQSTWTGAQASKARLRQASRSGELLRYRYVHFATHAWAQPDRPESSAIALGGPGDTSPTQRALTAAELAGLRMGSELIVLSACDTGLGHFEHGRGLLGLAYSGLAAGNRAALLSLWPIADDTTAQFMERLYENLRQGANPVSALAATQREFRRSGDPRLSDPLVWAPFVLYGGY